MVLDTTDWAADQYLPKIPTEALVAELRKRGGVTVSDGPVTLILVMPK